jgi:protein-S-isoprenylcysteine O-methyltransferase Ste14
MALQEELERSGNKLFRYRGSIPLIFLVVGLLFHAYKSWQGTIWDKYPQYALYYELFCLLITFVGFFTRIYTVGHTPANTSGRNTAEGQVASELNTTGIYSMVRHPLYLGNFFMWVGIALLISDLWFVVAFCFFYWVYYERIMYAEEQFLRRKFGDVYLEWADKTPPFIPKFSLFKKPRYSFSWKKVIKKEKNGLAAIFIIFSLFYVVGQLVKRLPIELNYLLISCITTTVIYLILKIIKSKTHWLDEAGR